MARWVHYLQRQARLVVLQNRRLNWACEVACLKKLAEKTQASIHRLKQCKADRLDRSAVFQPKQVEQLEPRMLFSAVNGVELFYNDSAYDGNDAAITVEDFDAIATDKEALTELEQASFENYSSYHKGINGVMIEIDRRPYWAGEITVDDFVFRTAPAGQADGNPFQWELADAPTSFEFLPGPNYSGTAVMTWDDASAVKNGWLQITVLPNSNTQLRQREVYYFGSAVGETGNAQGSTRVDISDYIGARYNLHSLLDPAPIDDAYDINRDKKVDALDMSLMRNNFTNFQTDLDLITAAVNEASGLNAQVLSFSEVFLRWFEHSHIEAGYQVTGYDSQGNTVYDEAIRVGATGHLVEGLAAGSTYTFEITPIVPDGYAPGPAIEPARVTFTTEERLTNGGQGGTWYSVALPKEALTRGEAGYGGSGSLSVAQQLVLANSPEAAVYSALTGDVVITDYHSQKSQLFPFNNEGAYTVGEKGDIPGFAHVTDPFNNGAINAANDQMLVVLEDTYGFDGTYSDRDYDDWYWKVDVEEVVFEALPYSNIYWESRISNVGEVPPPALWVPFIGGQGELRLLSPLISHEEAKDLVLWDVYDSNGVEVGSGNFGGGDVDLTLTDKTASYTIRAWLDDGDGYLTTYDQSVYGYAAPVYLDEFRVDDTRNDNFTEAEDGGAGELYVPLDGKHEAETLMTATLTGPVASAVEDAKPFLKWDIDDPQFNADPADGFDANDQVLVKLNPALDQAPDYTYSVGWDKSGDGEATSSGEKAAEIEVRSLALKNLKLESIDYPDDVTTVKGPNTHQGQPIDWIGIPVMDEDGGVVTAKFSVETLGDQDKKDETLGFARWEIYGGLATAPNGDLFGQGTFNADGTPAINPQQIPLRLLDLQEATQYDFLVGLDVDEDGDLDNKNADDQKEVRYAAQAFLYYFNLRIDSNNSVSLTPHDDTIEDDTTRPGKWILESAAPNGNTPLDLYLGVVGMPAPGGIGGWITITPSDHTTVTDYVAGQFVEVGVDPAAPPPAPGAPRNPVKIDIGPDGYKRLYVQAMNGVSTRIAEEDIKFDVKANDTNSGRGNAFDVVHGTVYDAFGYLDLDFTPEVNWPDAEEEDNIRYIPVNDIYNGNEPANPLEITPTDPDLVDAKLSLITNAPGYLSIHGDVNTTFWLKFRDSVSDLTPFIDLFHEDHFDLDQTVDPSLTFDASGLYVKLDGAIHLQGLGGQYWTPDILVEGLQPSPNNQDHFVSMSYVYDGNGDELAQDSVRLLVSGVDLDVDSDNTNGLALPDFSDEEEALEEDTTEDGKIIYLADSQEEIYTPLYLSMLSVQAATDDAKIRLTYNAYDEANPSSGGQLRIRTLDGTYLAPGEHDLSVLDIGRNQNDALLWIEVVDNGQASVTETIQIEIDPDGDAAESIEGYVFSDTVRVLPRVDGPASAIYSHGNDGYRSVISSDTVVLGMVDDPDDDLAGWELRLVPVNVHESTDEESFVIATSTNEIPGSASSPGVLGTIQPGLLDDGIYQLQLVATDYTKDDNGVTVPDYGRGRVVSGNLIQIQDGQRQQLFIHAETDIKLDVPGLPEITLGRYYDSRQADVDNGLGYGWSLTLPKARITRAAELLEGDVASTGLNRGDLITISIPGAGQYVYAFEPKLVDATPGSETWEPHFISIDGSGSVLGFNWDDAKYQLISNNGEFFIKELDGLERTRSYQPSILAGLAGIFSFSGQQLGGQQGTPFDLANNDVPGSYLIQTDAGWEYQIDFVSGLVTSATDPFGNTVTYSETGISAGGQLIHIERDENTGQVLWLSKDATGSGPKVIFGYDALTGELTSVTDQKDRTEYYTYDADHRLISVKDAHGVEQVAVGYEADGRVTSIDRLATNDEPGVEPEGSEVVYNERGDLARIIKAQYDETEAVTGYSVTVFTYEYANLDDEDFEPIYRTFDHGGVTYRYAESAFIGTTRQSSWLPFEIAGTDPDGLRYTQAPTVKTDEMTLRAWPEGFDPDTSDYALLDHLGAPVQHAQLAADGKTWLVGEAEYNHTATQATKTADAFGNEIVNTYDAAGNLIEVVKSAPDGTVLEHLKHVYTTAGMTQYTYFLDGTTTDVSSLASGLWLETVRVLDETTLLEVSLGSNIYYDPTASEGSAGRLHIATDRDGVSTRYTYWADGNLKETFREWDDNGTPVSVRQSYAEYNEEDQVTLFEDAVGNQTQYFYDATGVFLAAKDRFGGYAFSTYDVRGNLIRRITPEGIETRWAYNDDNLLTHVSDRFVSESVFTFDPLADDLDLAWDTTTSTALGNGATYAVTEYLYDSFDRQIGTVRHDNASIQITIDTDPVVDATIAPSGLQLFETAADLTSATELYDTSTHYDEAGRMVQTTNAAGQRFGLIYNHASFAVVSGVLKSSAPAPRSGTDLTISDFETYTEFRDDQWNQNEVILQGEPEEGDVITLTFENREGDQSATVSVTTGIGETKADVMASLVTAINNSIDPLVQQITSATLDADNSIQLTLDSDADFLLTAEITDDDGEGDGALAYADGSIRSIWSRDTNGHTSLDILNEQGRVVKIVYHDGSFIENPVDSLGKPITRADLNTPASIPTAELDGMHAVTTVQRKDTDPVLANHTLYDGSGNISDVWLPEVEDPNASNTLVRPHYQYEYDVRGNITAIIDPNDNRTEFTYDNFDRQVTRTLPIGVATTSDATDFVETRHYDDTAFSALTGDLAFSVGGGQLEYEVDFEGRVTAYRYDNTSTSRGRLAARYYYDTEAAYLADTTLSAADRSVEYTYNAFDQVTQVIDSGHGSGSGTTNYGYDDLNRLIQIESPEGILNYAYNDLNQVTRVWTSKTTAATDAITDTTYTYDTYGRLETVTAVERADVALANNGDTTTYHYDGVGNLDAQTTENGTSTVTTDYQFDGLNRLTAIYYFEDLDASLSYDAGTETLFSSFVYTLDSRGNRIASTDTVDGDTYNYTWVYDDVNRLISEELDASDNTLDYTDEFVYDLAGNRLSMTRDKGSDGSVEETTTYLYDANDRLTAETFDSTENGGAADDRHTVYSYDNTTRTAKTVHEGLDDTGTVRSQTSLTYNEMGRLESTTVTTYDTNGVQTQQVVTEYSYDRSGLRVSETTTTDGGTPVVKDFLFDPRNPTGFAQVLEEYLDGVLDQVYTLGHDVISQADVSDPQNQDVYTLLGDGHGSTRALTDELNAIIQQFAYDAYGNMLEGTNLTSAANALTSLLYSGEWTQANGSQYLRARFYDVASGTFNRLDPYFGNLHDPQSLHKYLYAHANPVAYTDPSGKGIFSYTIRVGATINYRYLGGAMLRYNAAQGTYRLLAAELVASTLADILLPEGWDSGNPLGQAAAAPGKATRPVREAAGEVIEDVVDAVGDYLRRRRPPTGLSTPPSRENPVNLSTMGRTPEEADAIREYARRSNEWLDQAGPQVIQGTQGTLRREASALARSERLRAESDGQAYTGQAGHVPDTAVTGLAEPPAGWLDMPGTTNQSAGGPLGSRVGQTIDHFTVDGETP